MATITPFTTPPLVRNALGIAVRELTDEKLNTSVNLTHIKESLIAISDTLPADMETVLTDPDLTPNEARLRDLGEMYCTLQLALFLIPAAAMFAPVEIKDDRTSLTRFADAMKGLEPGIRGTLARVERNLRAVYALVNPDAIITPLPAVNTRVMFTVGLGTDPVTAAA